MHDLCFITGNYELYTPICEHVLIAEQLDITLPHILGSCVFIFLKKKFVVSHKHVSRQD
jgi:hypothetical protein